MNPRQSEDPNKHKTYMCETMTQVTRKKSRARSSALELSMCRANLVFTQSILPEASQSQETMRLEVSQSCTSIQASCQWLHACMYAHDGSDGTMYMAYISVTNTPSVIWRCHLTHDSTSQRQLRNAGRHTVGGD